MNRRPQRILFGPPAMPTMAFVMVAVVLLTRRVPTARPDYAVYTQQIEDSGRVYTSVALYPYDTVSDYFVGTREGKGPWLKILRYHQAWYGPTRPMPAEIYEGDRLGRDYCWATPSGLVAPPDSSVAQSIAYARKVLDRAASSGSK